ncbi:MAG: hypothetical protein ACLTSD_02465 [Eubacterium sp.]
MQDKIVTIVQTAINEVNEDADEKLEYAKDTALFGKNGGIDSFSFVTLISSIEEQIQEQFGEKSIWYLNRSMKRNIILLQQ